MSYLSQYHIYEASPLFPENFLLFFLPFIPIFIKCNFLNFSNHRAISLLFTSSHLIVFTHFFEKNNAIFTMALTGHCFLPWFLVKCSQNLTQFPEVSNSFRKFLDSSRKSQTVLRSFKQFSEVLNSSRKLQMVLESLKQFLEVSNSSRQSQTVFLVLNSSRFLPICFIISCYFRWFSLIAVELASKVSSC